MLTQIRIKNFKSYHDSTMYLAPVTFFIGPNVSGKSNALEVFRLLNMIAQGHHFDDIESIIQNKEGIIRGNIVDLFKNPTLPIEIECTILDKEKITVSLYLSLYQDKFVLFCENVYKNDKILYSAKNRQSNSTDILNVTYNICKHELNSLQCTNQQAIFYQLESPAPFYEDQQALETIPSIAKNIRENLRRIVFLDAHPEKMRNYSFYKNTTMREDGSNVSSVLYNICTKENNKKQEIVSFIQSLPEQDITDINFIKTDRNDIMVQLCESFGGKISKVDAPLLSDGTLCVLAIATLLYSIEEYSIVIIEEIDNGIHPSRAKVLVKNIQDIATKRNLKIIVTSHNPALLDAIPSKIIGDILCCYRSPSYGESCISRLKDLPDFVELILQDSLGQLMTKNKIEYFAKFPSNYEERKNRTLSWISELENE